MIADLGAVIAWKWGVPFTARGEHVEIEGIGAVSKEALEAARAEWLKRPPEPVEPTAADIMAAIASYDTALAQKIRDEVAKRAARR